MTLTTAARPALARTSCRIAIAALLTGAGWLVSADGACAAQPDFGPNVLIFDPATPAATIQSALDAIAKEAEFSAGRHAVFFKPGTYAVDSQIGYYTTAAGLGLRPDDVVIKGGLRVEGQINAPGDPSGQKDSSLINFWRSVENLSVTPTGGATRWAVSQAAPMRRLHIRGGLALMPALGGYSSGGFIADSQVDGEIQSGSQQQWYSRDSRYGSWKGSSWNMVFSGVERAPAQSFPAPPMTTLATTPRSREKPFLFIDGAGTYRVFKPDLRTSAAGPSWSRGAPKGKAIPIDDFLIVNPATATTDINRALQRGRHVLFTPGVYRLTGQLNVTHRDTVLLGLGMATIVPAAGKPAIVTNDVDGIAIAGLIVEAGPVNSPVLVRIGDSPGSPAAARGARKRLLDNPVLLSDVFFRIGGPSVGAATVSLEVNTAGTIIDDLWAWRADHGAGVGWNSNTAATGLIVNGDDVTATGLFVEHYQKQQTLWNGEHGTTIFYQSELPYDPPDQDAWMSGATQGYPSYTVGAKVGAHRAYGLGVYAYFNQGKHIVEASAISVPVAPGVQIRDAVSVFLNGSGEIIHVVNGKGAMAQANSRTSFMVGN
jgi:hypothetical protein